MIILLIEVDPINAFGGSSMRDLYNMANHLYKIKKKDEIRAIYVYHLSIPPIYRFPPNTIFCKENYKIGFTQIVSKVQSGETLFCMFSSYKYQTLNETKKSNTQEQNERRKNKANCNKIFDELKQILIHNLPETCYFIGLVDTCYSCSMYDLEMNWNITHWDIINNDDVSTCRAISLGAYLDNQFSSCDINFGGSMTVHLIDNDLIKCLFSNSHNELRRMYTMLLTIFEDLKQIPSLQANFAYVSHLEK